MGSVDGVNGIHVTAGSVNVTVQNGGLSVADAISASTGVNATLNEANGALNLFSGGSIVSVSGGVTLTADNMALAGTVSAGTSGTVTLDTASSHQQINLGGADAVGTLGLTMTELNNITASQLNIGNGSTGDITVSSNIQFTNPTSTHPFIQTVYLKTGGMVTGTTGGIAASNLAINAGGPVTFTAPATSVATLAISTTSGSIQFTDNRDVTISTVNGVIGLNSSTTSGNIAFNADGAVNLQQAVNAGTGTVFISAATGGIAALTNGVTQSSGGTITASALAVTNLGPNAIQLTSANLIGTAGVPGLFEASNTGVSGAASGAINFANTSGITIGTITAVPVTGVSTTNGVLTLNVGGPIAIDAAVTVGTASAWIATTSGGISEGTLGSIAASSLGLSNLVTGDIVLSGNNSVQSVAISNATTGAISFNNVGDLAIGSASSGGAPSTTINGIQTGSSTITGGNVFIQSSGNLNVNQSVTTMGGSGGTVTVQGSTINAVISAGKGSVTLEGGSPNLVLNVAETSNSDLIFKSTGDMTISANVTSTNGSITVNSGGAFSSTSVLMAEANVQVTSVGNLNVSNNITATTDIILNSTNGNTTISAPLVATNGSIKLSAGGEVSSTNTLLAGMDIVVTNSGSLNFSNNLTATSNITLNSSGNATLSGSLVATKGTISANVGGTFSSTNTLMAGTDVLLTSSGQLTVSNSVTTSRDVSLISTGSKIEITAPINASRNITLGTSTTTNIDVSAALVANNQLTVSSGGTTTLTSAAGITTGTGGVTMNVGQLTTAASISTASGAVSISGPVVLTSNASWTTATSGTGANFTVNGTIDGTTAQSQNLSLTTGTGSINLMGNIGALTSLGNLSIIPLSSTPATVYNTTFGGSVNAKTFEQLTGGTTTFDGALTTTGGLSRAGNIGFDFTGQSLQFAAGTSSLSTNGHDATIATNSINLPTTSLNTGGGTITINPLNPASAIGLNDSSQTLNITATELNAISTSTNVVIGQAGNSGAIVIGTDGTVIANGDYTLLTGAGIQVNGLFQVSGSNTISATIAKDLNISLGGIETAAGSLSLNVGGAMMLSGTIETTAGNLTANVTGDLTTTASGLVQSTSGLVTLSSSHNIIHAGQINSGNNTLNMTAVGNMISSGSITSGSGTVEISTGTQLNLTSASQINSTSGNVMITTGTTSAITGGPLTMTDGAVISSGTGSIALTANGNITLGTVSSANNTATAINITSTSGSIANASTTTTRNVIDEAANSLVTLDAVTGIGSVGGPLSAPGLTTEVAGLAVVNASDSGILVAGDIRINDVNSNSIAIKQISQTGSGIVAVTSQGSMVVTAPAAGGNGIQSTGGSISLSAINATSNLNIQAAINSNGGNVALQSDDSVLLGQIGNGATGQVISSGGNISVIAAHAGTSTGQIDMQSGSIVDASGGTILMRAQGDIILGQIATTNNTSTAVQLASLGGGLVNGSNTGGSNINASASGSLVTIQTATGIGSELGFATTPQLQTNIYEVSITNGSSASPLPVGGVPTDINLNQSSNLQILQIVQNNPGTVNVVAQGSLDLLSTGAGVTSTSGNISLIASGSNGTAALNQGIQTAGGGVTVEADQNVIIGTGAHIGSAGGNITVVAAADRSFTDKVGGISMAPGTVINGGGGSVQLTAQQDIVLGSVISNTTSSSLVAINSKGGGIVSGGVAGVTDVAAGTLVLRAATGIGNNSALQINTLNLSILNSGSGNVILNSTTGIPLTIVNADGLAGITTAGSAPADISMTNNSSIVISAPITNTTGGNLNLTATGASSDITNQSRVVMTGGNGNVSILAGHNIHILNTGSLPEILVQNGGIVSLNALNQVLFDPNALVQTGTGAVANAPPLITNIQTPQLTVLGQEDASVTIGLPGEHNFTLIVNWGDGTIQSMHLDNSGQVGLTHFYPANPLKADPAAPITITFTLTQDPHVIVTANNVAQNVTTKTSVATIPGLGLASYSVNLAPPVTFLAIPELPKIVEVLQASNVLFLDNSAFRIDAIRSDQAVTSERLVAVEILAPDGSVQQRMPLPETVLDGTLDVIRKLPDGNYRFQLQEPGEERSRLLMEFEVRQGKIVDKNDDSYRPPTATKSQKGFLDNDPEMPIDADMPTNVLSGNDPVDSESPGTTITSALEHQLQITTSIPTVGMDGERASHSEHWLSVHQAWRRAERAVEKMSDSDAIRYSSEHPTPFSESKTEGTEISSMSDEYETSAGSVMMLGASAMVAHATSKGLRSGLQKASANLSRSARLFRKHSNSVRQ